MLSILIFSDPGQALRQSMRHGPAASGGDGVMCSHFRSVLVLGLRQRAFSTHAHGAGCA